MTALRPAVPKKILLASDLTPACDRAFDRAVQLASEWGAILTVFHVIEATSFRLWSVAERLQQAETEIERLVRDSRPSLKHDIISHVVVGDPAQRVVTKTEEDATDLIVTGPAHCGSFGEKLFGSTTARILRNGDQPVLAVRRRVHGPYQRIGVAIDLSPSARHAFDCALALFPKAFFTLVHAYQAPPGEGADTSFRRALEEDMGKFLRPTDPTGSLHTALEHGSPVVVMTEYVNKLWPDLVVAGTHGRSGVERAVIGSIAEGLLKSLPCDVLAVRAAPQASAAGAHATSASDEACAAQGKDTDASLRDRGVGRDRSIGPSHPCEQIALGERPHIRLQSCLRSRR